MQLALVQRGIQVSRSSVYRTMKAHGILHKAPRRPHNLTKADAQASPSQDLLLRDFHADAPGSKLVTDITQIQCADGKLYLAAVLDCWNGEILGISIARHIRAELAQPQILCKLHTQEQKGQNIDWRQRFEPCRLLLKHSAVGSGCQGRRSRLFP